MYICSCLAVTDGQIRKAVDGGISRWKDLVKLLHCSTQCGICGKDAKALFDKFLKERREREKETQAQSQETPVETPASSETSCAGDGSGCSACPKRATCPVATATTTKPAE
jgi:bacterioferritin-associated ferredoxin